MFYLADLTADFTPLRDYSKEIKEEPGYTGVQTYLVVRHQKITAN